MIDFEFAERAADLIEITAVLIIGGGVAVAIIGAIITGVRSDWDLAFDQFKRLMARGLLVGLALLIAADVIKTVTLEPTLENILGLGLLVLIRTFLSWSLILEVDGHWPWQQDDSQGDDL
jgi:uncharacterized membrane protein